MSKPIPVLQFFRGNPPYLNLSLQQAQRFNQDVILIGDTSNQKIIRQHYPYTDYNQRFQSFTQVYEHLSSNSADFETRCFQRFFVLHQWMAAHDQDKVFMIDSDLLLYANLTEFYEKYLQAHEVALCIPKLKNQETEYVWTASPHLSFWTRSAVESFTQFCLDIYIHHKDLLHQKYRYHQTMNQPGGICDMTLLYLWARDNPTVFNLLELKNGVAIDHNINSKDDLYENQYKLKAGIKAIYFEQGLPHEQDTGNQFLGIHFQGTAKPLMAIFTEEKAQAGMRTLFYTFPALGRILLKIYQRLSPKLPAPIPQHQA
jgi:hypothetical protein